MHENVFVTDLLVHDSVCLGALALGPDGQVLAYRAGAVVLGAGGARQMYPTAPGREPIDTTGDGYAMALRAGAELTNMEFGQYMLHALPPFPVQCPGSFWALFPRLRNRHGEDALAPYLPPGVSREQAMWERTLHYPFSCRDASGWLDVAIASEIRAGRGSEQGALYLDFSEADLARFSPLAPAAPARGSGQAGRPARWSRPGATVGPRGQRWGADRRASGDDPTRPVRGGRGRRRAARRGPPGRGDGDQLPGLWRAGGAFRRRVCARSDRRETFRTQALQRPLERLYEFNTRTTQRTTRSWRPCKQPPAST